MDEAKSMLTIGTYHDNIVNLQGISYKLDEITKDITKVSEIYHYLKRMRSYQTVLQYSNTHFYFTLLVFVAIGILFSGYFEIVFNRSSI